MTYTPWLKNQIIVTQPDQLEWTLNSDFIYVVDWIVDMGTINIQVPPTWLRVEWLGFWVSKLISSASTYSMFTDNWVSYSWDLFLNQIEIEATGTGSQVFDLDNQWNFWAVECTVTNFNDCTSLWTLANYRQGLELNTWRFWGSPTLTLAGTWVWGYRCTTSIVRSLSAWMTTALFAEWASFSMASRFLTDINCDLPTSASFCDFQNSNFVNPSTLQVQWAIFSRNLTIDASDSNIFPNIDHTELASIWKENQGIENTYVWGQENVTAEITTTINTAWVYETLAGTFTPTNLQHFDSPVNWQLRHLWNNPREFRLLWDLVLDWGSNDEVSIRVRKWDDSASSFVDIYTQNRQVNNLQWGRDVAFFTLLTNVILDQNDYVFLQVANISDTTNVTVENDSFFTIQER